MSFTLTRSRILSSRLMTLAYMIHSIPMPGVLKMKVLGFKLNVCIVLCGYRFRFVDLYRVG